MTVKGFREKPSLSTEMGRGNPMKLVCTLLVSLGLNGSFAENQDSENHAKDAHKKHPANRLAKESSPYLLMHAHNPVDWYPWGDEAFEKAKKEDKPIFLSIGYSSCYWCHVMEREVFSNEKIAKYMNEHFVNIKLDREERPDLDDIYMTSLVLYSGRGGWPMSMFLMPDGKPIGGGSYFPAETGPRGPGFPSIAERVVSLYRDQNAAVKRTADLLTRKVREALKPKPGTSSVALETKLVDSIVPAMSRTYDSEFGGVNFNPARAEGPKFPVPPRIEYLLHQAANENASARKMAKLTLDRMLAGGIRDHLAGGFHRYSTDRKWHVPHFEKMLYDQAQLATTYTQAWQQSNNESYKQTATEILDYVLSEFTDKSGAFFSALDAETNTIEGEYYVWDRKTIDAVLGEADAKLFSRVYGLEASNPFEHGFVLHLPTPVSAVAKELKLSENELNARLEGMRKKVLAERSKRERPLLDDKVLTSWNGLMVRAFAQAAAAFGSDRYRDAAIKAANFTLTELVDENGRLLRTWRGEKAKLNAYLDDYAFSISGLLALHEATNDSAWLDHAVKLQAKQDELFLAKEAGGYYFTSHDHEELIVRTRNANDGVIPSGNSVSVWNLVRLTTLTGDKKYRDMARSTLGVFAAELRSNGAGMANMGLALAEYIEAGSDTRKSREGLEPTGFQTQSPPSRQTPPAKKKDEPKKKKNKPVQAKAYLSVDKLPAGGKAKVAIYVRIQEGWHINADKPNSKYLHATKFTVKSKYGTKLTAVKYPKFKKKMAPGEKVPHHILEGTVVIYGLLEVPAEARGRVEELQLIVDHQACDDKSGMCKRPEKIVLGGKLGVAEVAQVKEINKEKFIVSKPRKGSRKQ